VALVNQSAATGIRVIVAVRKRALRGDALVTQTKRFSDKRILRYWVEIRELAGGSVRKLPLTALRLVCLQRGKKNEPLLPDREELRLQDDEETWEASDLDELKVRLRDKYPDTAYERTLHYVRDKEAEERRESALNELASIFAQAAVHDLLAEESRVNAEPDGMGS
jgi:hypothetical protein